MINSLVADSIRGSLMAGAAGDALGYAVEFMSRRAILSRYGERGIVQFELSDDGKALISDDTQMTLFTANGLLMGLTRNYMLGVHSPCEQYVPAAYVDWYYTQTRDERADEPCTWLRQLPAMYKLRAPGGTCMSACNSLMRHLNPTNNSKGCGGIMRVAPVALLNSAFGSCGKTSLYSPVELARAGGFIAECTHLHPHGYMPAAMLTTLLSRLVPITAEQAKSEIDFIVQEAVDMLFRAYDDKYHEQRHELIRLTYKAMELAYSDIPDAEAICQLGEGWTGDEAWAIALYSAVRHIDSVEDAIIASVNHDGDSDSTGAVCGNIMGAIYGYEHIRERNIFCPKDMMLEQTLELSDVILALANDLVDCKITTQLEPCDTPRKREWLERYRLIRPAGIEI